MSRCTRDVSTADVVAWYLDEAANDEFELHLLECDACATIANTAADIADTLAIVGAGRLPPVIRSDTLDALCRTARVGVFRGILGERVDCMLRPDLDYVALRVAGAFEGIGSLDVELLGPDDAPVHVERDAAFTHDEVVLLCSRHVAAMAPEVRVRLVSQGRELGRVVLVNHLP
jgi:hypothetical protein